MCMCVCVYLVVCDLETLTTGRYLPKLGCNATEKKRNLWTLFKQAVRKFAVILCTYRTTFHFIVIYGSSGLIGKNRLLFKLFEFS